MSHSDKKRRKTERRRLRKQSEMYPELMDQDEYTHQMGGYKKTVQPLSALNEAHGHLMSNIQSKDITFVTGPAGTGKTYIAAGMAADMLRERKIEKILITRPMIGCGEDMGHLPGDIDEKYAPWVQPVIDVLNERLGESYVRNLLKGKKIEAVPLQFMRGKSLRDSFVLCDEAQNITSEQMKMLLTRIGEGSKMVIGGDINQSDLKDSREVFQQSGLKDAITRLKSIPEIGNVEFTREDIVRHGLTRKILDAYDC